MIATRPSPEVLDPVRAVRHNPRGARAVEVAAPPLVALVVVIVVWQVGSTALGIPTYLLPRPADLLAEVSPSLGTLVEPTLVTVRESYVAFLAAGLIGVALALLMARWNVAERTVFPYLVLLQTIPFIAVAPILVVWLGPGATTNTVIGTMNAIFPVAANTLIGLKSTDRNLLQLFEMAGSSRAYEMGALRMPAALPYLMTGLRIAAGNAVIGAISGEFIAGIGGGQGGLGYVITEAALQLRMPRLFLTVVCAAVVSLFLFGVVTLVERLLLHRWHESAMTSGD